MIKTCDNDKRRFDVLVLELPDDANAKDLKESLDNAVKKGNLSIDRKTRKIGFGSDEANTNKVLYKLEKEEIGDWLIQILSPLPPPPRSLNWLSTVHLSNQN